MEPPPTFSSDIGICASSRPLLITTMSGGRRQDPQVVSAAPARIEVGGRQPDQDAQGGGLAGAVRAEEAGDPARLDDEAEVGTARMPL
jgi:hypothetical protein